jgi:hypothetical protein
MWQHGVEQETLLDALDWKLKKIADERDRLREATKTTTVEALLANGRLREERDRLRADNEFLKAGIEKHVEQGIRLGERAETAEAEIDRLREALTIISEHQRAPGWVKRIAALGLALAKEAGQ